MIRFPSISKRRRITRAKLITYGLSFFVIFIILSFIGSFFVFAWYAKDLPSPGMLSQSNNNSTVFYDRDGKILYEMYKDKNRVPVSFNQISDWLKKARLPLKIKIFINIMEFLRQA